MVRAILRRNIAADLREQFHRNITMPKSLNTRLHTGTRSSVNR